MILKFNEYLGEKCNSEDYQDFGCNYIGKFIKDNPEYDTDDFYAYVSANNKADRDSGESQDIAKHEIERLVKEYKHINEDAGGATTAVAGSGTAVGGGASGSFVSAAGQSVSGGDSGSSFSTNSNTSGMGAIVSAQPSSIPGDVAGSTIGSGDIGSRGGTFTKLAGSTSRKKKKDKRKRKTAKKAKTIDKLFAPNYTSKISENTVVKKFSDFDDIEKKKEYITLNNHYKTKPDEQELLWNFISDNDYYNDGLKIINIKVNDIIKLYNNGDFLDSVEFMEDEQKEIVKYYKDNPSEIKNNEIVISSYEKILIDGYHRVLAAYELGIINLNAIDIDDVL